VQALRDSQPPILDALSDCSAEGASKGILTNYPGGVDLWALRHLGRVPRICFAFCYRDEGLLASQETGSNQKLLLATTGGGVSTNTCPHTIRVRATIEMDFTRPPELKAPYSAPVSVRMCQECGHLELYADSPKLLTAWLEER
jgi:hypothetical protein